MKESLSFTTNSILISQETLLHSFSLDKENQEGHFYAITSDQPEQSGHGLLPLAIGTNICPPGFVISN